MSKERLLAFSDGVIAIIITIMVLELKVPHGATLADLVKLAPVFVSYVLSFLHVAIYWNNHHHMLHTVETVDGMTLWANTHLLFWLSLMPFATAWMGENSFAPLPVAVYGVTLLLSAIAYAILQWVLIRRHDAGAVLARAIGRDWKGRASTLAYLAAIPLAFAFPLASCAIYLAIALAWLVPDRRIETQLSGRA